MDMARTHARGVYQLSRVVKTLSLSPFRTIGPHVRPLVLSCRRAALLLRRAVVKDHTPRAGMVCPNTALSFMHGRSQTARAGSQARACHSAPQSVHGLATTGLPLSTWPGHRRTA